MKNKPTQLHKLYIVFPLIGSIKSLVPLAILLSIRFLNNSSLHEFPWFWAGCILVVVASLLLLYGYLSWKRFVYSLEEDKILIRRGILFREELSIYTGRIHSMNMEQPLVQRIFGLTQARIETPGKSKDGGILPAISNEEGERLQRWLRERTRSQETVTPLEPSDPQQAVHPIGDATLADAGTRPDELPVEAPARAIPEALEEERSTLLKLSSGRLLIAALTSPNFSLALAFVGGVLSFADDLLPDQIYQSVFQQAGTLLLGSWMLIAVAVLILSWLLSGVLYTIKYAGFTVERIGKQISVSCGLLDRKRLLFSPERVLAITVKEGIFRRLFGYAEVKVHVLTSESEKHFLLHPLLKTDQIAALLESVTPQFKAHSITSAPPARARWIYLRWNLAFAAAASAAGIWYFDRFGWLTLLLLPLALIGGLMSHRDSGMNLSDKQLTIRSRFIALTTRYVRRPQILTLEINGTRRQRRRKLLSLKTNMIFSEINVNLKGMEQEDMERVRTWFQHRRGVNPVHPEPQTHTPFVDPNLHSS
ncbi:PH domain-containing protein [Paenibacillus sp. JCM 10914]|uniref:PH domain-containing protein n=1 Tax=Paenibacillus sp. JCM 10914 TaxID=1236974 RepID=UPI0003CC9B5C|nr:PH domain-containing protein [Paenibacillus sp. JCM 10914]GAE09243.1 hypothetical protein, ydbT homolog [Paenibacillus sp. JCM 10914]